LRDSSARWTGGPYSERAGQWLGDNRDLVVRALGRYDRLAAEVANREFVITHGEPHAGNLIRTAEGLRLVDWDTVAMAPPERDLWMLEDLRPYEALTGWTVDRQALDFYRLAWLVTDVAAFVSELSESPRDDANTAHAWRALRITGEQLSSLL
jgi:spectinomycin phosphotransferase